MQREQLKLWFKHVKNIQISTHSAYLQCLLLTGARREEMAGVKWVDIDFQWNSIVIRDKVEGTRTIPLTPYVAALMPDLRRANSKPPAATPINRKQITEKPWKHSPWVFSSAAAKSGRIQEPRLSHNKALTAAGLPPLLIHGLCRSFGTWLNGLNALQVSPRKSWGINQAQRQKSTIAAARSTY